MTPTTPPEPVAGDRPPSTLAATACALLTMGIGLVALVGWGAGLEPLTRLGHDSTPMSPASASVAIVLAASLLGLSFQARWRGARLAAILAAAVGLAMSLTLLLVPGAAIEKLLAQSGAIAPGFQIFSTTGRASLLLAGTAATVSAAMLFQLLGRTPARKDIAGAVGLACAAGGSLFLIGYAYGSPLLSGNNSVPVSLPSALAATLTGTSLLLALPATAWPLRHLLGPSVSAQLLRAFLLTMLLIIAISDWAESRLIPELGGNPVIWTGAVALLAIVVAVVAAITISKTLGVAIDRTEKDLRESRDYLDNLFRHTNAPMVVWTPDGRITRFNHAFERLSGYAAAEVIGAQLGMLFPEETRESSLESIRHTLEGEPLESVQLPIICRHGEIRTVLWNSASLYANDGTTVEGTIAQGVDMTEQLQAVENLQQSEACFAAFMDKLPAFAFIKDAQGEMLFMNRYLSELLRIQDWQGRKDVEVLGGQMTEKMLENERRAFAEGSATMIDQSVDATGRRRTFQTALFTIPVVSGPPLLGGIGTDITLQQEAEEALKHHQEQLEELVQQRTAELVAARDEAEAANRAKSLFLANMSHELRTPLNAILGFTQVMSHSTTLPEKDRESLAIIASSGEHLLEVINDILDISKIEMGRISLHAHHVDPVELVNHVVQMMARRAAAKGLGLRVDQRGPLPASGYLDSGKFRQILVNLIGNAIKFTETGEVVVSLENAVTAAGPGLAVEIRDTGVGIAPEDLERIFLPFEQGGHSKELEGTGLGLAICQRFIRLMGGELAVDSERGRGSSFRFTVCLCPPDQADSWQPPATAAAVPGRNAGLRTLIVEDQPDNAQLLRQILEPLGFDIREAGNGQEGVDVFREWQPQLVLMDRNMPVLNGDSATREIRTLPGGRETVILALSAHAFQEEQEEMLTAGCDGFISKPFREDDLLLAIDKHLKRPEEAKAGAAGTAPLQAADFAQVPEKELEKIYQWIQEGSASELAVWLTTQPWLAEKTASAVQALLNAYRFEILEEIVDGARTGHFDET